MKLVENSENLSIKSLEEILKSLSYCSTYSFKEIHTYKEDVKPLFFSDYLF